MQGTLNLIILQTLCWKPRHGYGIVQLIRAQSRNVLQVETGRSTPRSALLRQPAIVAEWGRSENDHRVRMYRLTRSGHVRLGAERFRWAQWSHAIAGLMQPPEAANQAPFDWLPWVRFPRALTRPLRYAADERVAQSNRWQNQTLCCERRLGSGGRAGEVLPGPCVKAR